MLGSVKKLLASGQSRAYNGGKTGQEGEKGTMRTAFIGCMVMNREISHLVSESQNPIRTWWLRQGLHDTPDILRHELQRIIDEIERENEMLRENQRFEVICLGYGLCSNGVVGLRPRSLPLVIPRCDDCISLFLGSADRYRKLFAEHKGIYWYNPGWIEQAFTPSTENYRVQRAQYAELYGEENADFLMESTNSWMHGYESCGYITCPLRRYPKYEAYTKQAAQDFGWTYFEEPGEMGYFEALLHGPWDEERFLVCHPGERVQADYSNKKICAVKIDETEA